ncbi:ABC transporter permease [Natronorubrum sp. FCH18a]|uniref:ABC transporter permease n=1 Tax=Natronorubrum sp. FCH18a TaxID=3447018 RepID=UPI003F510635
MATKQSNAPGVLTNVRTRLEPYQGILIRLAAVALVLLAWERYAGTQPDYLFPQLSAIGEAFVRQIQEFGLVEAYARTMATVFIGYALAIVVGVAVGLSMGLDERIEVTLDPYVSAMYVAPVSALIPVIIMVGGASFESKIFVVFLFVVFEMIINTMNGTKTVPDGLVNAGRSFGGGRNTIVRRIVIPYTLPYIFAGMRLGIGRAIKGVILAELLIEFSNLGAIIREWEQMFQIAGVLSVTLLLMLTGIVLTRAVSAIRDRIITWEADGGDH